MSAPQAYRERLSIACLSIAIDADVVRDAADLHTLRERFGPYRSGSDAADLELAVSYADDTLAVQPDGVDWPGARGAALPDGRVIFERQGERVEYVPATGQLRSFIARRGLHGEGPMPAFAAVDTALRLALSHLLPRRGGLMVHASGYGDARGAVVFPALSGGGKTTTAFKLPPPNVLSDDQVALRFDGASARWLACAVPFVGMYNRPTVPRVAPLRTLAFLARGAAVRERAMPAPLALARILSCAPMYERGAASTGVLLDQCVALVAAVPCFELALALADPVLPSVERWLGP